MISFIGNSKLITLSDNDLDLSILWSDWVNWLALSDNSKYPLAFSQVGGDTINPVAGTKIPLYFFLLNGWKIRPKEGNHTLNVTNGILLTDDNTDPFVNTLGNFVVRINYQQPVQAITVSTGGGSASVDVNAIASAVWDKLIEGIQEDGSIGKFVLDNMAKSSELEVINQGVKKASILIPHTTNL